MVSICPKCKRFVLEYDPHQGVRRCGAYDCGWIDRLGITYTARESDVPEYEFSKKLANELPPPSL